MENLMSKTIQELAPLIRKKEISPVELVDQCLERIKETEPAINAYITVLEHSALEKAKLAEKEILDGNYKGVLHGIPYSAKDLYTTKGVKTTAGSRVLAEYVPDYDATTVARLNDAGAILVGKNNLHEFAYGGTNENEHFGPTGNPWNTKMIPGGSSGGSGASVAASSSLFSLGTDTGGSIRMPAALCGVVGIKATYGRVSRNGVLPLSSSLDHAGPLAKTTWDTAAVLSVMAGYDSKDPTSSKKEVPNYFAAFTEENLSLEGVTIGVCEEYFFENLDPEVDRSVRKAIAMFEKLGASIVQVNLPFISESVRLQSLLTTAEAYSYHSSYLKDRYEEYGTNIRPRLEMGQYTPAWAYIQAQRLRQKTKESWKEVYKTIDLLIAPTTAIPAFPIHCDTISLGGKDVNPRDLGILGRTSPSNFNGFPSISIPCGFTEAGLPIGLQLQGRPFEELLVFRAANAFEKANDYAMSDRGVIV
ncbi:amidase [Niallia nealsonii]|uniref:Asp-tRNA(Asn)/Glu-tRNA(Gln) amidotransferase subunit GatA n=1 Tax=Niallia nealsonii TaxID=115979 RepID=A0A2N0Z4D9_9BACI|nr:amidase [Niallia nealsonii]PKG24349.1 Asp-tRNA(Asn)/Glu-tRNA(Gln) amidotransferase subunit GatA [Niallia nealsonii]